MLPRVNCYWFMDKKKVFLTKAGFEKLRQELEELVSVRRPEIIKKIVQARQATVSTDNLELETVLQEQSFVEKRIEELKAIIQNAQIIQDGGSKKRVSLGSTVVVEVDGDRDEFTIVGSIEADPSRGLISNESTVGRALLGAKVGDKITVSSAVKTTYKILEIK